MQQSPAMRRTAICLLLAALAGAVPAADAKPRKRCHVKGATAILSNRHAVVLERTVEASEVETDEEVWGCLRKNGRELLVDSVSRDQYGSFSFDAIDLRGTSVFTA